MDSIKITSGEKRIAINDDPDRVIVFNPSDVVFAERFYKIVSEFEAKLQEYKTRYEAIDQGLNANGIPVRANKHLELLHETCAYVREKIDYVFGTGTSQTAFGDAMVLDMFTQFFDGITPFIQSTRAEKINKYLPPSNGHKKSRKRK